MDVSILFSHAAGDLELELYAPDCLTSLDRSYSSSDNEQITYQAAAAGNYRIQVAGFLGAQNGYDMVVDIQPAGVSSTPTPTATRPFQTNEVFNQIWSLRGYLPLVLSGQ